MEKGLPRKDLWSEIKYLLGDQPRSIWADFEATTKLQTTKQYKLSQKKTTVILTKSVHRGN